MTTTQKTQKQQSYRFGIYGELITIIFLIFKGYQILHWRYKNQAGEVDIIARKKKILIAVEVKSRKKEVCQGKFVIDEVLSKSQQFRIEKAMMLFVKCNFKKYGDCALRFDLVVVHPRKMPVHFIGFF